MSDDGLVTLASPHPVKDTLDRLAASLTARGITIFARIDHAAGAAAVGMDLRPTELLIFGNPKAGTPLMQASQMMGIDLPLRVLGWQDAEGKSWLTYEDLHWLARRHRLGSDLDPAVTALAALLGNLTRAAVAG
ncbi:MAG: camphor resistance protein CrcB [Rhodospirillales bacterium]|jgi:uncharacterized protein (DUF302 family)|nr:camphor resistance protein CrcB [Rhodospirillales bacterium]